MTDEVLKELWDTKDNIAKEHGYSVDALAEYFLKKQAARHGRFRVDERGKRAEQGAQNGRSQARAG
mgnify:FL=1|jgi:hypothetical protein